MNAFLPLLFSGLTIMFTIAWYRGYMFEYSSFEKNIQSELFKKRTNEKMIGKFLESRFFKPGWILQKFSFKEKLEKLIAATSIKITIKKIASIQQMAIYVFTLLFYIKIFLGGNIMFALFLFMIETIAIILMPLLILERAKRRRNSILQREIPYVIDMLSMCINSGMNIEKAFEYIGTKLSNEIGKELKKIQYQNEMGISFEESLKNLLKYITIEEYNNLITGIAQSKKLGTSMQQTLDIQAELIRTRRKQKAEEISKTATIKITLPLVFFIFPALLIIYIGPGILQFIQ